MSRHSKIAIYMRLSKVEDVNANNYMTESDESNSIRMQRRLLYAFVREHFADCEPMEFSDDGYSGINFQRPEVGRLLAMAREGAVDCIIVKDFSRFSRDYIELGTYLDRIFPFLGVRFISINDGYDSSQDQSGTGELDTAFKSLLYDFYSRDLSVKVKSALKVKRESGQYVSGNCPFGYRKDPNDRHSLVVAEDEAEIVRRIFAMAEQGMSSVQIAKTLNEQGIKTPIEYKMEKGAATRKPKGKEFVWSSAVICHILRNETYIGDMVYGKYSRNEVGGANHLKPEREWGIFCGHHEAIIDRERFEMIRNAHSTKRRSSSRQKHPLTGKAVCGCCGRNLFLHMARHPYFRCPSLSVKPMDQCVKKADAAFLSESVLHEIRKRVEMRGDMEQLWKERKEVLSEQLNRQRSRKKALEAERNLLKLQQMKSYEHKEDLSRFGERGNALERQLLETEQAIKVSEKELKKEQTPEELFAFLGMTGLTQELAAAWIDHITVGTGQEIEICWSVDNHVFSVDKTEDFHYNELRSLATRISIDRE